MSISIYKGSILDVEADYIVNPANNFLLHAGGLAQIIDNAAIDLDWDNASDELKRKAQEYILFRNRDWHIPTGDAVLGPPGVLPYKGIIHAVGPIYLDGNHHEDDFLREAYFNSFRLAQGGSVVVPAIGAGIFGNPIDIVAQACHDAYEDENYTHEDVKKLDVTIALIDEYHIAVFKSFFLNTVGYQGVINE